MKLRDCINLALRSLLSNKLRSILTILGITIGVAALISIIALSRGDQEAMRAMFQSQGDNLVIITTSEPALFVGLSSSTLTLKDADEIARHAPSAAMVAPVSQAPAKVVAGSEDEETTALGVTPEYQHVRNLHPAKGSFITDADVKRRARVVVLGSQLAESLFGQLDPVGQTVKINKRQFKVIGVLEPKGATFGLEDRNAVVPLTTLQSYLLKSDSGRDTIQGISIQARSKQEINDVITQAEAILQKRHHITEGEKNDFFIISMDDLVELGDQMEEMTRIILGLVAGVALVVAGIGIMNVMLMSVTERTREIGLRKAIGAKSKDILSQILAEAGIITLSGAILGIILGYVMAHISSIMVTNMGFPFEAPVGLDMILWTLGIMVFIGLASSLYPAWRAARLDPIEALRHE